MTLERRLLRAMSKDPDLLSLRQEAVVRWAIAVGRLSLFRTPRNYDVDLSLPLSPYREWLIERLESVVTPDEVDGPGLRSLAPSLAHRLGAARQLVLTHFVNDFAAEDLDAEIRHRRLVLVLGGGGGSGFVHLATFELMARLGHRPHLIVGSSMGSLLGLFRSLALDYDAARMAAALPKSFDLGAVFRPFTGRTRFGFPGAFHMQLRRSAQQALVALFGKARIPTFSELPIRLEVISTGVRTGFTTSSTLERRIAEAGARKFSPLALGRRVRLFFAAARELSANPRLLRQVVFGRERGTGDFNVVEAVGFSCSVPGLFHYDVFHDDPFTVSTLENIFERHRLWRLTDGGIINNVPSRVAWESVMAGNIGSRNAFILAADAFAPTGANILFAPVQQIARPTVLSNRPFSNFHKTFRSPPSPINLSPSAAKLGRVIGKAGKEWRDDEALIARALTDLPPYESWLEG